MTSDPWAEIPRPRSAGELSARRVDENVAADFFWARDSAGRFMLLLQHAAEFPSDLRFPKLRGVEIARAVISDGRRHLRFILTDSDQKDIFSELCRDIVAAAGATESADDSIRAALTRMWRWHHLLRSRGGGLLTEEQQKGLIGEILFIEFVSQRMGISQVMESWEGPLGGAKDFLFPRGTAVESKSSRGTDERFLHISSEWQLDMANIAALFLSVADVSRSTKSDSSAHTLTAIVDRLRNAVVGSAPQSLLALESRLYAAGYRPEDDYEEYWWAIAGLEFFEVGPGFPRVEGSRLPEGLERVTYRIQLKSCSGFSIEPDRVLNRFEADVSH